MNSIAHVSAMPASGRQLDNRRVIAGLIDLAVVLAGALVIGFAAGLSGAEYGNAGLGLSAVITAWALYYYFACESGGGQTLGKRAMKIRVVGLDGSPAGMRTVAVRTVLRLIDGLFLYLVGLIVMLVTGERRGRLGDLAARTMIVSADPPGSPLNAVAAAPVAPATITPPTREPEPPAPEPPTPEAPAAEREVASPGLKELAREVAAEPALPAAVQVPVAVSQPQAEDKPDGEEEPVVVNSVETVSAIDLVMEEDEEEPA